MSLGVASCVVSTTEIIPLAANSHRKKKKIGETWYFFGFVPHSPRSPDDDLLIAPGLTSYGNSFKTLTFKVCDGRLWVLLLHLLHLLRFLLRLMNTMQKTACIYSTNIMPSTFKLSACKMTDVCMSAHRLQKLHSSLGDETLSCAQRLHHIKFPSPALRQH